MSSNAFNQHALDLAVQVPDSSKGISTQNIAYIAMLSAACIVLNIFTLQTEFFAVSFTYIPTFIAGYFIGPFAGLLTGLIGDGLGCIIAPKGPWIAEITLASGLLGLIPAVVKRILKGKNVFLHVVVSYLIICIICSAGLNSFGLWRTYSATKKTFWVYLGGRLPTQLAVVAINAVLVMALAPVLRKALQVQTERA